jgi:DNA polymerase-3 subunit epsilon
MSERSGKIGNVKLHERVPELLVGFDVESTGLDTANDEAISYGFAEFVNGRFVGQDEFFVLPDIQIHPGAEKIHGVSYERLARLFRSGEAVSARAGASRAVSRLINYQNRGATFVGANPMFDFSMLDSTLRRQGHGGLVEMGFDLASADLIDVVAHDLAIDPDRSRRPRRGLAFLCEHFKVTPGQHRASGDARASGEVLLAQIGVVIEAKMSSQESVLPPQYSVIHSFAARARLVLRKIHSRSATM